MTKFKTGHASYNRIPIDETAFDVLDDEKAWMLGFLWADGCFLPLPNGYHLGLTSIDLAPVATLKDLLVSQHKISLNWTGKRVAPNHLFRVTGIRHLGQQLEKLGLIAGPKSKRQHPCIPSTFAPHFIRGLFDGDGSISFGLRGNGSPFAAAYFHGAEKPLRWTRRTLVKAGISPTLIHPVRGGDFCFACWKKTLPSLFTYIYADSICGRLQRKFDKFNQFMNELQPLPISQIQEK